MDMQDIIKLLDAGYSKDEIIAMNESTDDKPSEEVQEIQTESKEDVSFDAGVITDALSEIKTTFEEIKKEFTAMNIMNSRIDPEKSSDDILAEIINPFEVK